MKQKLIHDFILRKDIIGLGIYSCHLCFNEIIRTTEKSNEPHITAPCLVDP